MPEIKYSIRIVDKDGYGISGEMEIPSRLHIITK